MTDTIRVTVDAEASSPTDVRSARGAMESLISSALQKTIDVEASALADQISSVYGKMSTILSRLPPQKDPASTTKVSFSVVVDARGRASLLSAMSAATKAQTGITFEVTLPAAGL